MARISELHYSNAYAASSGVNEFLEVALNGSDDPSDFVVSFYQADGSVGIEIPLTHPDIQVSVDPDNGETIYVISADDFPILLTDPNGGGSENYEAYALTNTDTDTVIDFYDIGGGTQNILALDGAAAGATSENLPVLVGPNSTTTTLQFNQPDPDVLTYETVAPGDTGLACFVAGTRLLTPCGQRPIESLVAGDLVTTRDKGPMPVRWIGRRSVVGRGAFAPVRIARGALGAIRAHYVSQNHRLLLEGWRAELFFGEKEVLVPAKALVDGDQIALRQMPEVTYFHMMFDSHQIVEADGVASESFYPGAEAVAGVEKDVQAEIFELFPEVREDLASYGQLARPVCPVRLAPMLL
ncbi:Hint domain-containing protein [Shimia haliotis]|uniref:Hint domain-containing protein n=1 Tax=Shimia haliotis TaxID=1280847 RepID=A0A1I4DQ99_9RHOB|nr:Hint domain-containing protein [Shimia haliotis]SFK94206.1 Hint domain-containing protein [Shimia haliotis]